MLVLSRVAGDSIFIENAGAAFVVTILKLQHKRRSIWIRIGEHGDQERSGAPPVELAMDAPVDLGNGVQLSLVDLRGEKARVGFTAPREAMVHRLEVYEAIQRENRDARGGDDGPAGAPVPRPPRPTPPSLNLRLVEPRPDDDGE